MQEMMNNDDEKWGLTPWGCMHAVLKEYGYDPERLTPKMGEHMVEDFMAMMVTAGIVAKKEKEDE